MDLQLDHPAQTSSGRYQARRFADGFVLEGGADRQPVRITLCPTCWRVEAVDRSREDFPPNRFGLFEIRPLITLAAEWSMHPWKPRPTMAPEWLLRRWAVQQARRSVSWVVAQERQRLMSRVEPLVRDVQRAMFVACCSTGELALTEGFYRAASRFLIADVLRYRAAAMAVRGFGERLLKDNCAPDDLIDGRSAGQMGRITNMDHARRLDTAVREACEWLSRWRDLFSDTDRSYSALNRTLDGLPGGMSHRQLCALRGVHLERPIHDRVELTVLLATLGGRGHPHGRLFQFARREEILRALPRVANAFEPQLSPRRRADLSQFATYVCDFPEPHHGNIVGLVDRSIRWHREAHTGEANLFESDDTAVARPPIPLPEVAGLSFLDTVGAIRREGYMMGHCIASYVPSALMGHCFLFHYELARGSASVEVTRDGEVRQARGPGNDSNRAARAAECLLGRWAATFPPAESLAIEGNADRFREEDVPF